MRQFLARSRPTVGLARFLSLLGDVIRHCGPSHVKRGPGGAPHNQRHIKPVPRRHYRQYTTGPQRIIYKLPIDSRTTTPLYEQLPSTSENMSGNNKDATSTLQSVVDQASAAGQSVLGALTGNPADKVCFLSPCYFSIIHYPWRRMTGRAASSSLYLRRVMIGA